MSRLPIAMPRETLAPGQPSSDGASQGVTEQVLRFGDGGALVGVLTLPDAASTAGAGIGIVLINAGLVHRVGPNRVYVKAARAWAAQGHAVLRFDLSGIGDSAARTDALDFQASAIFETAAAMATLGRCSGAKRFVLAGICSGADVAFLTACARAEVAAAVLINGQSLHGVTDSAGDEIAERLTQTRQAGYLWKKSLFSGRSWKALLGGQADIAALCRTLGRQLVDRLDPREQAPPAAAGFQADFAALLARGTKLLLVYSEGDPGVKYLQIMLGRRHATLTRQPGCTRTLLPRVDHTFTPLQGQQALIGLIGRWVREQLP